LLGHTPKPDGAMEEGFGIRASRSIMRQLVWGTARGALGGRDEAITIQFSIMYILGVRAVKGADADEVLFVG
jgi:hypothetical protein